VLGLGQPFFSFEYHGLESQHLLRLEIKLLTVKKQLSQLIKRQSFFVGQLWGQFPFKLLGKLFTLFDFCLDLERNSDSHFGELSSNNL